MQITRKIYFLSFLGILLLASCKSAKLSDARAQYLRGEYFAASETYRKIYRNIKPEQRPLRGVVAYEMAETYRRMNAASRSAAAYANAIRYNYPDTLIYLRYAQMLHKEGNYLQAHKAYEDFLALDSINTLGITGLQGVKNAMRGEADGFVQLEPRGIQPDVCKGRCRALYHIFAWGCPWRFNQQHHGDEEQRYFHCHQKR